MASSDDIQVMRNVSETQVEAMGVRSWPVWDAGVTTFPWEYHRRTTCFVLDGEATVTADGGQPITVTAGDLCVFKAGLRCTWSVTIPVMKHLKFD